MAENAQTLREDLTCPICVEVFTEPVLLPCQHNFFRECSDRKSDSQEKDGEADKIDTGTHVDVAHTSDYCDDHGLEIIAFCGSCQRLMCKNCFEAHDGHCLKALSVIYGQNMEQTKEKITALNEVKEDMEKMLMDLTKFEADVEEKKSLHIAEIGKAYEEIIGNATEWQRENLKTVEDRYEGRPLACAKEQLVLKIQEIGNLLLFSNDQLSASKIYVIKGHNELITRIVNLSTSAKYELQCHKDASSKFRDDMEYDVVIRRNLYFGEETISTPRLRFTEKLTDCVLIKDNDTVLVNVKQEGQLFTGALTDGRFFIGSHYWELDLRFNVKKTVPKNYTVCSAGVVRKGSNFGHYVGCGNLSWGVEVAYHDDQFKFVCRHEDRAVSTPVPVYPESEKGVVRQGFYLSCEDRTLTITDHTNNRVLYTFRSLDLSEPLTPAVTVDNYDWVDVSVRITPCNLSDLVKVLHDNM